MSEYKGVIAGSRMMADIARSKNLKYKLILYRTI